MRLSMRQKNGRNWKASRLVLEVSTAEEETLKVTEYVLLRR